MIKYKRKFLVTGNTPKKRCWDELSICEEICGKNKSSRFPCGKYSYARTGHFSKCLYPERAFNQYVVSEDDKGHWSCSCKGWIFKYKKLGIDCDHIKKAKANPEKYEMPVENTGTTVEAMRKVFENV